MSHPSIMELHRGHFRHGLHPTACMVLDQWPSHQFPVWASWHQSGGYLMFAPHLARNGPLRGSDSLLPGPIVPGAVLLVSGLLLILEVHLALPGTVLVKVSDQLPVQTGGHLSLLFSWDVRLLIIQMFTGRTLSVDTSSLFSATY